MTISRLQRQSRMSRPWRSEVNLHPRLRAKWDSYPAEGQIYFDNLYNAFMPIIQWRCGLTKKGKASVASDEDIMHVSVESMFCFSIVKHGMALLIQEMPPEECPRSNRGTGFAPKIPHLLTHGVAVYGQPQGQISNFAGAVPYLTTKFAFTY
eukprot:scaffold14515_cov37-Prasinocladus_malaysianus.AAC.1